MSRLSLRNVCCDFYLDKPNGFNRPVAKAASRLPIIRIFGILESGQKCCVHVHGVFPYILLSFDTPVTFEVAEEVRSMVNTLVGRKDSRVAAGESAVYSADTFSTKSIYGYYKDVEKFVKVSFCSPYHASIVTQALHQEALSNTSFQVYEAHVPYLLQFFLDYALFGMDMVHLRGVKYRISPRANVADVFLDNLTVGEILGNNTILSPLLPATTVAVECDVFAEDIMNVEELSKNEICNPGLNYIWKDEERRCRQREVELKTDSSQENRSSTVNDAERNWLRQLREICGHLKSLLSSQDFSVSSRNDSTFFNDTIGELDGSLLMNEKNADGGFVGDFFSDDEAEWVKDEKGDKSFEAAKEHEDAREMTQPLSTLYYAEPGTSKVSTASDEMSTDVANVSGTSDALSGGRVSTGSDDMFGNEISEKEVEGDIPGTSVKFNEGEFSNLSPDMFNDETMESGSSKSGDLFGGIDIDDNITDENTMDFQPSTVKRREPISSSLPVDFKTEFVPKTKKSSQPTEFRSSKRTLDRSKIKLDSGIPEYECLAQRLSSDSDDLELNPAMLFEADIGDLFRPNIPEYDSSEEPLPSTSKDSFYSAVTRCAGRRRDVEEEWYTPSFQLPLRDPSKPASKPASQESKDGYKESVDSDSGASSRNKKLNASLLESWCEPSFFNYSMNRERLEATVVIPEEPQENPDEAEIDIRYLCVLSLEVLAAHPVDQPISDPQSDAIIGVFCSVVRDVCLQDNAVDEEVALLNLNEQYVPKNSRMQCYASENELLDALVTFIRRYDPDIVLGYSAQRNSWGYLVERSIALGRNLLSELSRYKIELQEYWRPESANFSLDPTPRGRLLVNVWRVLRGDLALRSYTLSNVVQIVLSRRFPQYSTRLLTDWVSSQNKHLVNVALRHMLLSARLSLQVLCQLDFFTRTAEMARVYGIQFSEVLSRGSQFRVESMLLRLARLNQLAAATVSPAQRSAMPSPETLALNMEPESGLYRDPVIVLDFQSLYPSVMIAYNYCFSTCLGRVTNIKDVSESGIVDQMQIGALSYSLPVKELIKMLKNNELHISPVGGVFCKKSVRKGVIPVMLEEILNTRIMVKKSMKEYKKNVRLSRILDARQLALKMVANVTYGYSAANWSGRMPCVEVADAIVSKGREALEGAIAMVNAGLYGSARVIYGDTDSLFVLCPGSSRQEAFDIGDRIANDVTMANPNPMKLKLEKIMQPLILETKKRYVGMSYEKREDNEPVFDAKGIETVRRDSCPIVSRVLEKALRLVFDGNFSALVRYMDIQLSNLDKLPLTDFIFSREYRKHYAETAVVPAKKIAEKRRNLNPRYEPEAGERVPYVIVAGPPDSTLISCVREPWEYAKDKRLVLNYDYYVQRQILPSLHRALSCVPVKFEWHRPIWGDCYHCGAIGVRSWCANCASKPEALYLALCDFFKEQELKSALDRACRDCMGLCGVDMDYSNCNNLTCLVAQKRVNLRRSKAADAVRRHRLTANDMNLWF